VGRDADCVVQAAYQLVVEPPRDQLGAHRRADRHHDDVENDEASHPTAPVAGNLPNGFCGSRKCMPISTTPVPVFDRTTTPRLPFGDKVEVWLAPELGYLPVRLKLTQAGGDFADMQLREQGPLRPSN